MDADDRAPEAPDGDDRTIDDLIEVADEIPERLGLSGGLAAIRASAQRYGLSVTVDVHGMLVALNISETALELGPDALAAEISRLATEAGTEALRRGMQAIRAGCVPAVAAAVEDVLPLDDPPEPTPAADPEPTHRSRPRPATEDEEFVLKPVTD
ncbi:hypothetical protein [Amycolatopsis jejuensis]|uniref:hypothetical protein n=1 Tax=Amycolatopsis jejuensis TaxID=330084 RepID=UPI00068F4A8B|nr:hypothetical protein [Amycolatopsis jejuensis]